MVGVTVGVTLLVGVTVGVMLLVGVIEGVMEGVTLTVGVIDWVGVSDGVKEGVNDGYAGHCEPFNPAQISLLFQTPIAEEGTGLIAVPI